MEQEELIQFVQWLPSKVAEFQDKTPEEIVGALNQMAQSEEGMNAISGLINQFKQEQSTRMFKKGGKINYLINMFRDGGSTKEKRQENKKTVKEGKKSSKFNRTAYRNMKSALKDQDLGLGRRDIKAAAIRNIVGDTNSNITKQEGNVSKPVSFGGVTMKMGPVPKANVSSQAIPDLSQGSFNQAFAAARKGGLSTFNWRGKSYGTQLAPTRPTPSKPNLPNDNTNSTLAIPQAVQQGTKAAQGIRPNNMNEELIISSPLYNDYIVMSNLSNPGRFDSRYTAPKKTTTRTSNNATLGYIPIEHRINPRNLGSFFQKGGKVKTTVKVNPNDSVAVTKALNNRTGDNNVHDIFNTTGLVRDSLIKVGYNPIMVNRIANPIISNAEKKLDEFSPEQYTPRQQNLLKFLQTHINYWAKGTADTGQAKSDGYKSERITNPDGSIREIVTNPNGKRSYRDISADRRDTTYTNDLSSMSRSNNPKWWRFRDKKVERQEYNKRDKAFNKRFNVNK